MLGRRAFSVAGPMAWNALPDDFRDTSLSANNFRKGLKTHLFQNALGHLYKFKTYLLTYLHVLFYDQRGLSEKTVTTTAWSI